MENVLPISQQIEVWMKVVINYLQEVEESDQRVVLTSIAEVAGAVSFHVRYGEP